MGSEEYSAVEVRKLYYEDCHLAAFSAEVLSCEARDGQYLVELDQTAFYPEGGGQAADTGTLGQAKVLYTFEKEGRVLHQCDRPLTVGQTVEGRIDWELRFDRMQQHTGEHIISGLLHKAYGCHNTGFHMGADTVTIDFDAVIPPEALPEIEAKANQAVWADIPLKIWTPSLEELPGVVYRTKRALPWPVRIVQVPMVDSCACCGVHVARTGEVGLIKLLSAVKFRGGTRMEMLCGRKALAYLSRSHQQNLLVSRAFSAKLEETGAAAERMNELLAQQKWKITELETAAFHVLAEQCEGLGNVLIFKEGLEPAQVRRLAELVAQKNGGVAAVFSGTDQSGYSYCLAQVGGDLRRFNQTLTQALNGRGGGRPEFQQGSVKAGEKAIRECLADFTRME